MSTERPWAYSAFPVEVAAVAWLSPRFVRITLRGEALEHFAPWGLDQRIKVVLPLPGGGLADFGLLDEPTPHPSSWYSRWKELDPDARNVLRTYTPAAIRASEREIDVDFYLHEPAGPASAWAAAAQPGERLVITGPDSRMGWTGYGIHWSPAGAQRFLLIGDETAYPALRNIVASLEPNVRAHVILGVSDDADDIVTDELSRRAEVSRVALGSDEEALVHAVAEWGRRHGGAAAADDAFAVWVAGEAGAVTGIRRHLTRDIGVAAERIAFLGYWKRGGALVG